MRPECKTVHISWGIDEPSRRIFCASQIHRQPAVPEYDREYEGYVCFDFKHSAEMGGDHETFKDAAYGVVPFEGFGYQEGK